MISTNTLTLLENLIDLYKYSMSELGCDAEFTQLIEIKLLNLLEEII